MSSRINEVAWEAIDWAWDGGAVGVGEWCYRVHIANYLAAVQAAVRINDARGEGPGWDIEGCCEGCGEEEGEDVGNLHDDS